MARSMNQLSHTQELAENLAVSAWLYPRIQCVERRVRRLLRLPAVWYARASARRALASLDERALKDIGVSKVDVTYEASKPFWRK